MGLGLWVGGSCCLLTSTNWPAESARPPVMARKFPTTWRFRVLVFRAWGLVETQWGNEHGIFSGIMQGLLHRSTPPLSLILCGGLVPDSGPKHSSLKLALREGLRFR